MSTSGTQGAAPTPAVAALRALPGLERAWPDRDRGLVFEARDSDGRLRAGRIDAGGSVYTLAYAQDPALPDLSARLLYPHGDGRLVVHRAGRRAVVLGQDRVRKLVRPGRAARLADPQAARPFVRAGLRTARVLDRSASRLDLELLPGSSLRDLGDAGMAGWERLVQLWPAVVRPEALPEHTGADEAEVLRSWRRRTLNLGMLAGTTMASTRVGDAVARVCAVLEQPGDPLAASHRDLHDAQLLWDGSTLSLLDLDTACLAEPALDVGNLAAHVDLMLAQNRLSTTAHGRVASLLEDLGRQLASRPRLSAYYLASRLRLIHVHAFRPGAETWLPAWTRESLRLVASPGDAWADRAPGE
ncbi:MULTISPECIES: serine kinase [unclassified Actinomyces]|uniref:serine kinase n=1 Tax=unclassified Actinomyces TaxID=2609248 RepID=UPI0013A6FF6F|nr:MULTISPECIES: serine kinase [unclassified Actinomyces]MBW3069924.1 serine kinase [Actinomyces sp. 594]NDR54005.1 serine kinase [Actinomyces sp. 565]